MPSVSTVPPPGPLAMVSTRTTAQSHWQREVQRLDCSVPGLLVVLALVVHILRPLGVALVLYYTGSSGPGGGGRAPPWLEALESRRGSPPAPAPAPELTSKCPTRRAGPPGAAGPGAARSGPPASDRAWAGSPQPRTDPPGHGRRRGAFLKPSPIVKLNPGARRPPNWGPKGGWDALLGRGRSSRCETRPFLGCGRISANELLLNYDINQ
jgi:hypothetical protein